MTRSISRTTKLSHGLIRKSPPLGSQASAQMVAEPTAKLSGASRWSAIPSYSRSSRPSIDRRTSSVSALVIFMPRRNDMTSRLKRQWLNFFRLGMVHPCGSGAFGYFECTKSMSDLTKANFLQSAGQKTPIFIRFSTVTLGREFPDSARNPRGFAIKFYTGEGNYDIVGLNWVSDVTR